MRTSRPLAAASSLALLWVLCSMPSAMVGAQARQGSSANRWMVQAMSEDPDIAQHAVNQLSVPQRGARAVAELKLLLDGGVRDTTAAVVASGLGQVRHPHALPVLESLLRHRAAVVRAATLSALARWQDRPDVAAIVARGLRDLDPTVRAAAATALAAMGARTEIDALLLALRRGVLEAAGALGEMGNDDTLAQFNALLGTQPLAPMLTGYAAWLRRPDVSDATKLRIVATLEDVAGITVKRFLQALGDSGVLKGNTTVQRAVSATIARIPEPTSAP